MWFINYTKLVWGIWKSYVKTWKSRRLIAQNWCPLQTFFFCKKSKRSAIWQIWKNSSYGIILFYAHFQYVNKHSAKFQRSRLKAVGGVDYTKKVPSIDNFCKKMTKFHNVEKKWQKFFRWHHTASCISSICP